MSRAKRRHHQRRVIAKATRILMNTWTYSAMERPDYVREFARKNANHMPVCSCTGCSRNREDWGDPINERRQPAIEDWDY